MEGVWKLAGIFAVGALAGGVAAGWLVGHEELWHPLFASEARTPPKKVAPTQASIPQQAPCPAVPTINPTSAQDGQLKLVDKLSGQRETDVHGLVIIGKEAAAGARARDAEVAFIMACRVATQLKLDSVSLADAKYQLGWHYATVAGNATGEVRDDLSRRARPLYEDALRVYTARLGGNNEKTQFAANGLAALRQPVASAAPPQPAITAAAPPKPEAVAATPRPPVVAALPRVLPPVRRTLPDDRRNDTRVAGAPRAPAARPSFDCAKAHSRAERMICGDAQLAQLDRELGQLYSRAKARAADPADFKRHSDAEWRRRETSCSDRQCLLAWYAQRRAQLLDEIDARRATG
ncbi:MAG TPA: hypothetical protein VMZ74_06930 [Ramlibacter sp.]|nr:hypothetical protein [Ramlibacter sp.]